MTLTLITGTAGQTITARLAQGAGFVGDAIACPESPFNSGRYVGTPTGFALGVYDVLFYSGGTLSGGVLTGGALAGYGGPFVWDGTKEVTLLELAARTWAHTARSLTDKTGFSLTAGDINSIRLDLPTVSNLNDRTLPSADYFDPATDGVSLTLEQVGAIAQAIEIQLAEEFNAIPDASENAAAVRVELSPELDRMDEPVSSRSTFDAANNRVDIGAVSGVSVTGPNDLKATGFSTLDQAGVQSALTAQGYTSDRAPRLDKLNVPGTLANTDNAATFRADLGATNTAIAQALTILQESQLFAGLILGKWVEAKKPQQGTPGYIRTEDGIEIRISINPDGSERMERIA